MATETKLKGCYQIGFSGHFFVFLKFCFCFVAAICDLVWRPNMACVYCLQHLEIFSEI